MAKKIALITGANAGIGKYTALGLAKRDCSIVMAVRNTKSGEKTKQFIKTQYPNAQVDVFHCDLSSQQSVRKFSGDVHKTYEHIDILIKNAAAFFIDYKETEDGFERQWQINHLAHFLLTQLVVDLLRNSGKARIVNVSSSSHYNSSVNLVDPNLSDHYNGLKAYGQSKLANILFTNALARRLNGNQITANSLHPGAIRTKIGSKNINLFARLAWLLSFVYRDSPRKGAETPVFLACDPSLDNITGNYFEYKKTVHPDKKAMDTSLQESLWQLSLKQTGVTDKIS